MRVSGLEKSEEMAERKKENILYGGKNCSEIVLWLRRREFFSQEFRDAENPSQQKMIAQEWELPLFRFDIGSVL